MTLSAHLGMDALDALMPMHVLISAAGHIVGVGSTLQKLRHEEDFMGKSFCSVFEMRDDGCAICDGVATLSQRINVTFKEGRPIPLKGVATPILNGEGMLINLSFGISVVDAVAEYRLTAADFAHTDLAIEMLYLVEAKSAVLDEAKKLNARLRGAKVEAEEKAFTDTLTGLKNRRAMDHVLERMIASKMPFAFMNLDLDFFKAVNDTMGHAAGDAVLRHVGRVLLEETRSDDLVARIGGDEFVLIFNGLVDERRLMKRAARIITQLELPIPFQDKTCEISASIGITTTLSYSNWDADRMIGDADIALYESKHKGRAQATFFTPEQHAN